MVGSHTESGTDAAVVDAARQMDVFQLRERVVDDYRQYITSFISIRDERIRDVVDNSLDGGLLWSEPRIGLNPSFETGGLIDEHVESGLLHSECSKIFRIKEPDGSLKQPMRLHRHQLEAIKAARTGANYVLTTGTGSGKSLSYIIPIVDRVLRNGSGRGIKAIVVYPMNALANSQFGELEKFVKFGYAPGTEPVRFQRYTGQETDEERQQIIANPPDILLTNYVMLELILTRVAERPLVRHAKGLEFLVFDELHTYRGRQGADVALLARRVREACEATNLQVVGTSATMSSGGTFAEQQAEIARVASLLFGSPVLADNVIGETLRRSTQPFDATRPADVAALRQRVLSPIEKGVLVTAEQFAADPLSGWIEATFGIRPEPGSGRLVRMAPQTVRGDDGAASKLAALTELPVELCSEAIEQQLLLGNTVQQDNGFPVFAFRLHQFFNRGETVHASLEPEAERFVSVAAQHFVPGDRTRVLLPLVFCRECGQEYYAVARNGEEGGEARQVVPPADLDKPEGYLYLSSTQPWPSDEAKIVDLVPEDWVERTPSGTQRIKRDQRKRLPEAVKVSKLGELDADGVDAWFIKAPFRFCICCGVAYPATSQSDKGKLATLGTGGRSTSTTILSAAVVRSLLTDPTVSAREKKLLAFSDNRQDASLQAGHFNDFIEVGMLRSALYRAVEQAGDEGLTHDVLAQRVAHALDLPPSLYMASPDVKGVNALNADKAFRDVLGYRLYLDQRRGWRLTSPNLEQTGLLRIDYLALDDAAADEEIWEGCHDVLSNATPAERLAVSRALLDHLRRELSIKVDYLEPLRQETITQNSNAWLAVPWAIDENEQMTHSYVCYPRSQGTSDLRDAMFLSRRSGFGKFLRRPKTFESWKGAITEAEAEVLITDLFKALAAYGLVVEVVPARDDLPPGYQLQAAAMVWRQGSGAVAPDPIKVPRPPQEGMRPNRFFTNFYKSVASDGRGLEAREHTAQVPMEQRLEREKAFRNGTLPVLYCSPTMELGVDIAGLLVVGMRNVPPTPANYAQRSGRAGRSGQPALVFTYCTTGSPHDQFFFRRQERMVAGSVSPPRLDLTNEDLVRAHVQAVWLSEAGLSLGSSMTEVLQVDGDTPSLELLESVRNDVDNPAPRAAAAARARKVLADILPELEATNWWSDQWLDQTFATIGNRFRAATNRWVGLYRAALEQVRVQTAIRVDAGRSKDHAEAERQRREAVAQLDLLRSDSGRQFQSDFYTYRYFASEGFLPGYSFPRLPLSAWIPARRAMKGADEYLSRPRFLAISEFGPRNFLYHEGSRYQINKVILPVPEAGSDPDDRMLTRAAKVCDACGYLHPLDTGQNIDLCEACGHNMGPAWNQLFRMQNVVTKRRDRINSDEEERRRHGYDLRSGVRFAEKGPISAQATRHGTAVAELRYGHSATIWRINLGWKHRKPSDPPGFVLDIERGYWAKAGDGSDDDATDPMTARTKRVIPYVDDTRNAMLITPAGLPGDPAARYALMASLQAALKTAIQVLYQLEDTELAVESLPSVGDARVLLLYESAEGGAGVLRRLVEDPNAFANVARQALEISHFDPVTGEDKRRAPGAREDCEAGCYDCLLSYYNQPDHQVVDRALIVDLLRTWTEATVEAAPGTLSRAEQLERLSNQAGSELERRWLRYLDVRGHHLPTRAQVLFTAAGTRPDFIYDDRFLAVYVDGPPHDFADRQVRDATKQAALEELGWSVKRFRHDESWDEVLASRPDVFGTGLQ